LSEVFSQFAGTVIDPHTREDRRAKILRVAHALTSGGSDDRRGPASLGLPVKLAMVLEDRLNRYPQLSDIFLKFREKTVEVSCKPCHRHGIREVQLLGALIE
jgi:hypothetical protein